MHSRDVALIAASHQPEQAKLMHGLQDQLEVFVITDPDHPAKKYTAETLAYLDIRTEERGVKAKKVTHFLCLKINVSVIRAPESHTPISVLTFGMHLGEQAMPRRRSLTLTHQT